MTAIDLTVQLAPILCGVVATLFLSAGVIIAEALRSSASLPVRPLRVSLAAALIATYVLLVATALVREAFAL